MKRIFLGVVLTVCIVLGAVWEFVTLPDARERMEGLALVGEGYIGQKLFLVDWEKAFFKDVNVLKRYYRVGDQELFLTALDGTHNRHVVHDPYYCFKGSGWESLGRRPIQIAGGSASILTIRKGDVENEVLYWFSDGFSRHASVPYYLWQTTLRKLTLGNSGPEPLLIMVQPINASTLDWERLPKEFPELFKL